MALGVIGLVGSAFLLYLAWESVTVQRVEIDVDAPAGSLLKAIGVNLLNPHPYVFWVGVGGPLVAEAWAHSWAAALAFLVGFFLLLCGSKLALAVLVGRMRHLLQGAAYLWTVRTLGAVLALLAVLLAWDAVGRLAG